MFKTLTATATAIVIAVGFATTAALAESSGHKSKHSWLGSPPHTVWRPRSLGIGFGTNIQAYDGPIYNQQGQIIGFYRGPVLGYSSSCDLLTPTGHLYACQNFTW
jgi:hypothetical protein